jgi:hypothetical protein
MNLNDIFGNIEEISDLTLLPETKSDICGEKTPLFFDVIKKISSGKKITELESKVVDHFMLLKWASGDRKMVKFINEISIYQLPKESMILAIQEELKQNKITFISFAKKEAQKFDAKVVEYIVAEYQIREDKVIDIMPLIKDDVMKQIKKSIKNKDGNK